MKAKAIENVKFGNGVFSLRIERLGADIKPFQFMNVKIPDTGTLFRRPFSIFDYNDESITLLIKVVGRGTEYLSTVKSGDTLDVLMPLGSENSRTAERGEKCLYIAGGIGIAGLHASFRRNPGMLSFGDRDGEYKDILKYFSIECDYYTETGKVGRKGFASEAMKNNGYDSIVACGPFAMFKTIKEMNKDKKRFDAVCEEIMACGAGLCGGCTIKYDDGTFKKVCTDGPLLDGMRIVYE